MKWKRNKSIPEAIWSCSSNKFDFQTCLNSFMVTAAEWNGQSLVYFLNTPAPTLKYLHIFIPASVNIQTSEICTKQSSTIFVYLMLLGTQSCQTSYEPKLVRKTKFLLKFLFDNSYQLKQFLMHFIKSILYKLILKPEFDKA